MDRKESPTKIRFLDAEISSPRKVDWAIWLVAAPIAAFIGSKFAGAAATASGILLGFTLSAFGVSILRAPKAFMTIVFSVAFVYAMVSVVFE